MWAAARECVFQGRALPGWRGARASRVRRIAASLTLAVQQVDRLALPANGNIPRRRHEPRIHGGLCRRGRMAGLTTSCSALCVASPSSATSPTWVCSAQSTCLPASQSRPSRPLTTARGFLLACMKRHSPPHSSPHHFCTACTVTCFCALFYGAPSHCQPNVGGGGCIEVVDV
jgi:hypothetical protein